MVQGYYTLQEAAQVLALSVDDLRQMAQRNQIRSFQDRGTLRFRVQDIQELARQRGAASDLDLPLGEAPKTPKTPKVSQLSPKPLKDENSDDFDFSLEVNDDQVDIGREVIPESKTGSKSSKKSSPRPLPGSDSDVRLIADGDMTLEAHSDSDIRLVSPDSDVKVASSAARRESALAPAVTPPVKPKSNLAGPASPVKPKSSSVAPSSPVKPRSSAAGPMSPVKPKSKMGPGSPLPQKKSGLRSPKPGSDSGIRLVPMDSDSDVKIVGRPDDEIPLGSHEPGATDSDIRLERFEPRPPGAGEEAMLLTEEINLDEELRKQEEALKKQPPQAKLKPKSKMAGQTTSSPFELSDHDLDQPKSPSSSEHSVSNPDSSDLDLLPGQPAPDSSDFDLVPAGDGSVLLEPSAGDDFSLELPDDSDFTLAEVSSSGVELKGPTSGINLADPVDAGLSLEQNEGSVDFEISLDGGATPKPAPAEASDSSSEFEINLDESSGELEADKAPQEGSDFDLGADVSSGEASALGEDSSSEFEISLSPDDSSGESAVKAPEDSSNSDSEFELTLDDSGSLPPEEEAAAEEGDKDIFETDFEVPGLEDESGSQVAALDTDTDESDFNIEVEDESGSQVVAIDEEEADDAAATVAPRKRPAKGKTKVVVEQPEVEPSLADFDALTEDEAAAPSEEEEPETSTAPAAAAGPATVKMLRPAPWGVFPVVFMLPCLIVMVLVGLLGFELIQNSNGYKPAGFLTKALAEMMSLKVK